MKVLPKLTASAQKIMKGKAVATKIQRNPAKTRIVVAKNISSQARENLERYAEEMKPETYLEMRNYISRLEMEELMRNGKL